MRSPCLSLAARALLAVFFMFEEVGDIARRTWHEISEDVYLILALIVWSRRRRLD